MLFTQEGIREAVEAAKQKERELQEAVDHCMAELEFEEWVAHWGATRRRPQA